MSDEPGDKVLYYLGTVGKDGPGVYAVPIYDARDIAGKASEDTEEAFSDASRDCEPVDVAYGPSEEAAGRNARLWVEGADGSVA
jgi:hypothetical protein